MSKPFKPMLAGKADPDKIKFPVLVSPKLDGIRAYVRDGVVYSRSNKPIRNEHVQQLFGVPELEGYDGELIVGRPYDKDVYRTTNSAVMSREGNPDVWFYVFDSVDREEEYAVWLDEETRKLYGAHYHDKVVVITQHRVECRDRLIDYEKAMVTSGYEGVMIRSMDGPYKQGRSTTREGYLLKLKRFEDSEAIILECLELMHNNNEATVDETGHVHRSSHQENKEGADTMGKIRVADLHTGVEFSIGTGFSAALRQEIWDNREQIKGKLVKYKYFPVGVMDKPRHPVFLGFRDNTDLDSLP